MPEQSQDYREFIKSGFVDAMMRQMDKAHIVISTPRGPSPFNKFADKIKFEDEYKIASYNPPTASVQHQIERIGCKPELLGYEAAMAVYRRGSDAERKMLNIGRCAMCHVEFKPDEQNFYMCPLCFSAMSRGMERGRIMVHRDAYKKMTGRATSYEWFETDYRTFNMQVAAHMFNMLKADDKIRLSIFVPSAPIMEVKPDKECVQAWMVDDILDAISPFNTNNSDARYLHSVGSLKAGPSDIKDPSCKPAFLLARLVAFAGMDATPAHEPGFNIAPRGCYIVNVGSANQPVLELWSKERFLSEYELEV